MQRRYSLAQYAIFGAALGALLLSHASCGGGTAARRPFVLLISCDTLRADRLGAYGSDRGLTPNLDRLASQSLVFEAAYAPSAFTGPSVTTLMTGRHPVTNGIMVNENILPDSVPTLATRLSDLGYRTGAVISNFVLRARHGLGRGFDTFDDKMRSMERERPFPERVGPDTTDDALAQLDALRPEDGGAFLWVHYQDPHGPYTPPSELLAKHLAKERARPGGDRRLVPDTNQRGLGTLPDYQFLDGQLDVGYYRAAYHAEIELMDRELGRLLDALAARGALDQAIVIFTADHGEGLGENDYWFAHGEYLLDGLVRVPLFVRLPGQTPGRRADVAGLIDVLPTVLAQVGLGDAALGGRDLLAPGAGASASTIYMNTMGSASKRRLGLVHDGHKYLVTLDKSGRIVEEVLAPLGGDELAGDPSLSARIPEFRQRMGQAQQQASQGALRAEFNRNSNAEAKAMEALGYGGSDED